MAVANTTVFEMLGKEVSFIIERKVDLTEKSFVTYSYKFSGIVTNVILGLTSEPEISINDGDFYILSRLVDFKII